MHLSELFDQLVKGLPQRLDVESEGWDLSPVWSLEQLEDVSDIVVLVQDLTLKVRVGS